MLNIAARAERPQRGHGELGRASSTPTTGSTRPKRVTGLIMTQILPFADPRSLKLYGQFEEGRVRGAEDGLSEPRAPLRRGAPDVLRRRR